MLGPWSLKVLAHWVLSSIPDTLDEGSNSKKFFIELAQNKDVKTQLDDMCYAAETVTCTTRQFHLDRVQRVTAALPRYTVSSSSTFTNPPRLCSDVGICIIV
jgi:hypothetical protein